MLYRTAEFGDIPAMARIRASEWGEPQYWEQRISGYLAGQLNPRHARGPRTCYVAANESTFVAFAAGHLTTRYACDGELQWINVIPESRGIGVASELLRLMARWFISNEASRICVDVDPNNSIARAFYTRHGAEKLNEHWLVWSDISAVLLSDPGDGRGG